MTPEIAEYLTAFVRESNLIEGIHREPRPTELSAYMTFLDLPVVTVSQLQALVDVIQRGARLREYEGMNVSVGSHLPLSGGPWIRTQLAGLLLDITDDKINAHQAHHRYETLHPFMDGNGRSGRALWLWMKQSDPRYHPARLFLHEWYYESLQEHR